MIRLVDLSYAGTPLWARNALGMAKIAGRRVSLFPHGSTQPGFIFQQRVKMPHTPSTRWQHTESGSEAPRPPHERRGVGSFVAGGLTSAALINLFLYMYDNTPADQWPDFMKKVMELRDNSRKREIDQVYRDLRLLQQLQQEMTRLNGTLDKSGEAFESLFGTFSKKREEERDTSRESVKEKDNSIRKLEQEKTDLSEKLRSEKQRLEQEKTELLQRLTKEKDDEVRRLGKEKQDLVEAHKKQTELLAEDHTDVIRSLQRDNAQQAAQVSQLVLKAKLYQFCSSENGPCVANLHKFLSGNHTIDFSSDKSSPIDEPFMNALSTALMSPELETTAVGLNFSGQSLSPTFVRLMEALKTNKKIEILDLGSTSLSLADMRVLAEMLKVNRTIKEINLYWSNFGDDEAAILESALEINKTVKKLNLSYTNISKKVKDEMEKNLGISIVK